MANVTTDDGPELFFGKGFGRNLGGFGDDLFKKAQDKAQRLANIADMKKKTKALREGETQLLREVDRS